MVSLIIILFLIIQTCTCSSYWNSFNMYRHEDDGLKINDQFKTDYGLTVTATNFRECLRECTKNKECAAGEFEKTAQSCVLVRLSPTINNIETSATITGTNERYVFYRDYDRPCPASSVSNDVIKKIDGGFKKSDDSDTTTDSESYKFIYSGNKKCIEPDIFKGLTALNSIDITITTNVDFRIPKGLFVGLTNLQTLKFLGSSGHGLSTISQTTFQGLIRLKTLVLDTNVIDFNTIHPRTFAGLRSLISFKAKVDTGQNTYVYTPDEIALIHKYCGCSVTVDQA